MNINANRIIKKLKDEKRDTVLVSYRLDKEIKTKFTKLCDIDDVSAAKVIEQLMQAFIDSKAGR